MITKCYISSNLKFTASLNLCAKLNIQYNVPTRNNSTASCCTLWLNETNWRKGDMILCNHMNNCFLQNLGIRSYSRKKKSLKEVVVWIIRSLGKIHFEDPIFESLEKKHKKNILINELLRKSTSPSYPSTHPPEASECYKISACEAQMDS